MENVMTPAVYVQTNDASDNEIVAFSRSEEARLPRSGASHRRSRNRRAAPALAELRHSQRRRPVAARRELGQ